MSSGSHSDWKTRLTDGYQEKVGHKGRGRGSKGASKPSGTPGQIITPVQSEETQNIETLLHKANQILVSLSSLEEKVRKITEITTSMNIRLKHLEGQIDVVRTSAVSGSIQVSSRGNRLDSKKSEGK